MEALQNGNGRNVQVLHEETIEDYEFNYSITFLGIFMVWCSWCMIEIWDRDINDESLSYPGYIHYFLGMGISMCVIAWFGHVALKNAKTNFRCFVFYVVICVLVVFVNLGFSVQYWCSNTKEAFPEDPSGKFDNLKNFAEPIFTINSVLGLVLIMAQMTSLILAGVQNECIDENDVYSPLPKV